MIITRLGELRLQNVRLLDSYVGATFLISPLRFCLDSFKLSLPIMVASSNPDPFKLVSPIVDALNDLINTCELSLLPDEYYRWERRIREKIVRVVETYGDTFVRRD